MLQIVFSERMQLAMVGDPDPNTQLLTELAGTNTFMQVCGVVTYVRCVVQSSRVATHEACNPNVSAVNIIFKSIALQLHVFLVAVATVLNGVFLAPRNTYGDGGMSCTCLCNSAAALL